MLYLFSRNDLLCVWSYTMALLNGDAGVERRGVVDSEMAPALELPRICYQVID